MKNAHRVRDTEAVDEMTIVDTFTKLIFGEADHYSRQELLIIQALRMVDTNVLFDSHQDMGQYLRALGVGEMIQLVTRVQQQMARQVPTLPEQGANGSGRDSVLNRRAH